ncbi:BRCA1-associated [Trema orientale]|uniref:BRCA1-associated n=1 Tax=Trema orientale TaxID=63057 RepID=A0A2P5ADS5_TREOI|nr:BRCA1-associated [Trema orientale]
MRIVRNDGMEDRYSILIRLDSQDSTDNFYKHFNGSRFSSLEAEVCRVLFTVDVQYTGSIEHAQPSPASSAEQPTCPVCLGDNYVHRLIQSKTDGKLVELNSHCFHANDGCGSCDCVDSGFSEALLNSRVEAIVNEYNELLTTQLENQKSYFESLLQEVKEETEKEISVAVEKAVTLKLQKMQTKLDRCLKEKNILDDLNENLLKNQEIWKEKITQIEDREKKALKLKDDKIRDLEEQLRDLMVYLEAGKTMEQLSMSDEIKDGTLLPKPIESPSKSVSNANNNRRRT